MFLLIRWQTSSGIDTAANQNGQAHFICPMACGPIKPARGATTAGIASVGEPGSKRRGIFPQEDSLYRRTPPLQIETTAD